MNWVLLIAAMVMLAVYAAMVGVYRWLGWTRQVEERLTGSLAPVEAEMGNRRVLRDRLDSRLRRLSFAERLERQLVAADSNMSVSEFMLMRLGVAAGAFVLGWAIAGQPIAGLLLALIGWLLPGMWLRRRESRRARDFANQLPDMLTMLIGSLRAGYGLLYAITIVEKEMPNPIATEFGRVIKETALGYSLGDALDHLVQRVQNDDLALIVTAIHIQNEVGGSLAEVLETISRTIRERVQLKGQIRAITAQQQITGSILSALPFLLGTVLFLMSPDYMMGIFTPGWPLIIPVSAAIMVIFGNLIMRKVTKIDI
jgi:tight adherence protein B